MPLLGSHAGIDHTMVQFDDDANEKLLPGDKVLIKGYGSGLELVDYPSIKMLNMDPRLLEKINPKEKDGKIFFPVVTRIPAFIMGAGM